MGTRDTQVGSGTGLPKPTGQSKVQSSEELSRPWLGANKCGSLRSPNQQEGWGPAGKGCLG